MRLQILHFDFQVLYSFYFESEVFWRCARGNASEYSGELSSDVPVSSATFALGQGAVQVLVARIIFRLVGFCGNHAPMALLQWSASLEIPRLPGPSATSAITSELPTNRPEHKAALDSKCLRVHDGRRFADATVLRAAAAFEQARPWNEKRPSL
jgi:hypothetical protein